MTDFIPAKFCPGCGHPIVLLMLKQVLSSMKLEKKAVLGLDIGCSLLAWNFLPINTFQTHHGRVSPVMTGFKRARPDSVCIAYTGDGGAYSIGMQSLLYSAKRDEPILVLVVNNTVYAMTGGQTAPTTITKQKTTTNPNGYEDVPIFGPELLKNIANKDAYLARTAVNNPLEMQEFIKKGIEAQQKGHFALIEFLSFCPTMWKTLGKETIDYLEEKMKPVFKIGEL